MRHSKTVSGAVKIHLWDGQNMIAESANGQICARYYRGANLIAWQQDANLRFYLHNAHGDVMHIIQDAQTLYSYDYDAFGNEKSPNAEYDGNPFRYCGEYYDREIENVYLRARYYDTSTGRFTQEDPIEDGENWYAYCNSNPVAFVDPSGYKLIVSATGSDRKVIMTALEELIDHKLSIKDDGEIYIKEKDYAKAEDIKYEKGNELLLRFLNDTKHTTTIEMNFMGGNETKILTYDGKNGGDTLVRYDPMAPINDRIMAVDPETKNVSPDEWPDYIGLGHELSHADRARRGVAYAPSQLGTYKYQTSTEEKQFWGFSWTSKVYEKEKQKKEELAASGLKYTHKNDITENDLRAEHGIKLRGAYNPSKSL